MYHELISTQDRAAGPVWNQAAFPSENSEERSKSPEAAGGELGLFRNTQLPKRELTN